MTAKDRDPELLRADAFERFYRSEQPGQIRRAILLLGSEADANDAVAHAFSNIYERWDHLDEPGAYLNRSVLNSCRDIARRRSRVTVADVEIDVANEHDIDQSRMVMKAVLELPYKQRAVVVLRHYAGLNEAEIADQLGIAQGSVGPTLFRAQAKLKKTLKEFAR